MSELSENEPLPAVSETLDTELKGWLRIGQERDEAILAKALMALRNNNGGQVVLGIDDKTCSAVDPPSDLGEVRQEYHADKLSAIVAKYALHRFEVRVEFREFQGRDRHSNHRSGWD
jgi:hypothetical protein